MVHLLNIFFSNYFMLIDLQEGELVHGENFSLFAAMSALEVLITDLFPCWCLFSSLIRV